MSDDADRSDLKIEAAILEGVRKARVAQALAWTGACLNCEAEVAEPLRFCDADCRDDFDRLEQAKRRSGRA